MNRTELLALKCEILPIHELATEPVADPEPVKRKIEELFEKLEHPIPWKPSPALMEAQFGEKTRTTT